LEKSGLPLDKALDQIRILSQIYGPERIIWRYDPIAHWIRNESITTNHDPRKFEDLCRVMHSHGIQQCYFSFVHRYQKFEKRFAKTFPNWQIYTLSLKEQINILDEITTISSKYNITLYTCCNDNFLANPKIKKMDWAI